MTSSSTVVHLERSLKNVAYVRLRLWDCQSIHEQEEAIESTRAAFLKVSLRQVLFYSEPDVQIQKQIELN